ncbi:hypothetical protein [Natrarchaeobaculum sulfurireducens]|uniref:hypothetical protein n=1 Tax=Natrarchaeobaculum sulfurireducens TaxID=2044521 RepID=UPI00105AB0A3|nr:hypothetical protein [Natrarchaeobaculum sulfurireducens]
MENIDDDTLFTTKQVSIGGKKITTPTKAIPIKKIYNNESILTEARGFNEVYFQVDDKKIQRARSSFDSEFSRSIGSGLNNAKNGEINAVFAEYKTTKAAPKEHLEYLSDLIYSTSDILTVPRMPALQSAIKEDNVGTASKNFQRYMKNLKSYLEYADQMNGKPIMGVIPTLPPVFTSHIIDLYFDKGVRAFYFDFDGRKVTAEKQLTDMVTPLMRRVSVEDLQEDVLLYSLNAHRGRNTGGKNYTPAADFMTFGFGLDVLGDKHVGGKLPPHLYEKINEGGPSFRVFHKDEYTYQSYEYDKELRRKLPLETGLDADRILGRPSDNYRLSSILNGEQQGIEARRLHTVINEHRVKDHIYKKKGVGSKVLNNMKSAKREFDGNSNQSKLDELDDLF